MKSFILMTTKIHAICRLLFGVDEKMLTQHILGPVTKYKLLYVSNQGRVGARAWAKG